MRGSNAMFEKHYRVIGIEVKKETKIKKFSKYFCNDEHANQFVAKIVGEEKRQRRLQKKYQKHRHHNSLEEIL